MQTNPQDNVAETPELICSNEDNPRIILVENYAPDLYIRVAFS